MSPRAQAADPADKVACGFFGGLGTRHLSPTVITSGSDRAAGGFAIRVSGRYFGWDRALERLRSEAAAIGAAGVIGVAMTSRPLGDEVYEFLVAGTAVSDVREAARSQPFVTTLDAGSCSKLLSVGWQPRSIIIGTAIAIRHDDYRLRLGRGRFVPNREVGGLSDLSLTVRRDARWQLFERARREHVDGVVLDSAGSATLSRRRAGVNHFDHIADITLVGNGVVGVAEGETQPGAMVMPVS